MYREVLTHSNSLVKVRFMRNETSDYRRILREKLAERCERNPKYSLRAYARDLKIAPARLSNILNGRFGLSREGAKQICERLGLSTTETENFCDLVDSKHARSQSQRKQATARLQGKSDPFGTLALDSFKVVSDWYYNAILELTLVHDFKPDADWIAKRLSISPHQASDAITRLLSLDLLEEKKGTLRPTGSYFTNAAGIPSDAVRKFHGQTLEKAKSALILQAPIERDFSNLTLAIDPKDLGEVREMIKRFRNELATKVTHSKKKSRVYNLSVQFFALDEIQENHKQGEKK